MTDKDNKFTTLYNINVNDKVEEKNGLSYLSWAWAWAEFKKVYPNATYEIKMYDNKPYIYDPILGYMVFTSVTVWDLTHDMWLPVMDSANKSMLDHKYTYKTKWWDKTCEQASMFDVNKTIMRCLVKNLAMFGLGLYIYAGEDLPENLTEKEKPAFTDKEFESMKSKQSEYTYDTAMETIKKHYTIDQEMTNKVMDLYGVTAWDLF